jgi:hypothetical protein
MPQPLPTRLMSLLVVQLRRRCALPLVPPTPVHVPPAILMRTATPRGRA